MKMKSLYALTVAFMLFVGAFAIIPAPVLADQGAEYSPQGSGNAIVFIQNRDAESIYFALLFADRAIKNEWMDNIKVIFWGPAQKTMAELPDDSDQVKLLKGIIARGGKSARVWACKACADRYGVADRMEALGCEVFHVGNATSYLLKLGYRMWNW